jgi:hypothetical protein
LTAPGLQFKGAGWYVNDYAPKSGGSSSESTKTDSKTESKPDTKTETKAPCGEGACAACPAATASSTSS